MDNTNLTNSNNEKTLNLGNLRAAKRSKNLNDLKRRFVEGKLTLIQVLKLRPLKMSLQQQNWFPESEVAIVIFNRSAQQFQGSDMTRDPYVEATCWLLQTCRRR